MTTLASLLHNRNFIFMTALALGLFFPQAAPTMRHLILPALALAMIISTMEIGNDIFRHPRKLLWPAFLGIVMNYILLGFDKALLSTVESIGGLFLLVKGYFTSRRRDWRRDWQRGA